MPLDASDQFSPFTANGLAAYVGNSVKQVVKWNAGSQGWDIYTPGGPGDYALEVGGSYFLLVDSGSPTVLSLVGDVPDQGSISFALVKETGQSGCKYNSISLPLDQDSITNAQQLVDAIGGVAQVVDWDATNQGWIIYSPGGPGNFAVSVGYPYIVCLNNSAPANWPE
jgi:hypothetical protein